MHKIDFTRMKNNPALWTVTHAIKRFPAENLSMRYFSPVIIGDNGVAVPWEGRERFINHGEWEIVEGLSCCFSAVVWLNFASSKEEREMPIPELFMYYTDFDPWEARILLLSCEIYGSTRLDHVYKSDILKVLESIYENGYVEVEDEKTYRDIMKQFKYDWKG